MNRETLLSQVAELVKAKLKPLVDEIDRNGLYPEDFMRELGAIGGFGAVGTEAEGGNGLGLATQIAVLREVGKECGATSFSAWCQAACAWYLHQTPNQAVKDKYLADILQGKVLAGTGMSNTVKHLAGIEKHNLQAERVDGGYKVNGALPWPEDRRPAGLTLVPVDVDFDWTSEEALNTPLVPDAALKRLLPWLSEEVFHA